ncbi:MAG: ABC transporter permease [Akkermansiaceae bacterium]|nr:ABC transporter permease [Akkermansiaceae bacterium]MCP5545446.1 ABC transporter permease [Akkermansiaceae bacterium]MCP5548966.1 ABC transporter permease [Akkermansiaceae bacterium]
MNEVTIEAGRAERQYWRDLWRYRELFYFLAWRDILVRYKQTVIGVAWAAFRPLLTVAILTFVFARLGRMVPENYPAPLFIFCGMLPWQFFATAFAESGSSLVSNAGMISKVYFPRLVVPVSSVITSFVDFLISMVIMSGFMIYYQFMPPAAIAMLPVFMLMAFATAFGGGLWISALMVRYRDFRFIVPFVVQLGLYISPVAYDFTRVPEEYRLAYSLNPMVGVISGFRWAILGEPNPYPLSFAISGVVIVLIIVTGVAYFRKTEKTFADVI